MKRKISPILLMFLLPLLTFGQNKTEKKGLEEFEKIIAIALKNNPAIQKALKEIEIAEGEKKQAGYFPNPEIEAEIENFGGELSEQTFSSAEITFYISQTIETGGKRRLRKERGSYLKKAAVEKALATTNSKLSLIFELYNKTAIAKQKLILAEQLADIARKILNTVSEKVKYGKTSPIQELKAQIEYDKAILLLKQAQSEYQIAKSNLIYEMGISKIPENIKFVEYYPDNKPIKEGKAEEKIKINPLILEKEFLRKTKEKELKLVKAENIPDLNLSAGIRKFKETDQTAYVLSIGFKLPLFNRNKGKIMAKASERDSAYLAKKETLINLTNKYFALKTGLETVEHKKYTYETRIIPNAEKAYQSVFIAYREGKIGYLELLDTQRTLIEARNQYLEIKKEYTEKLSALLELFGYFSEKIKNKIEGETL